MSKEISHQTKVLELILKKPAGFTLIELLVVIAIIGLLTTIAMVSLGGAREKARDAKRVSNIKQIQTGLEMFYHANNSSYPTGNGVWFGENATSIATGTNSYMALPKDPEAPASHYIYSSRNSSGVQTDFPNATSYTLTYTLEGKVNGITGTATASPVGMY